MRSRHEDMEHTVSVSASRITRRYSTAVARNRPSGEKTGVGPVRLYVSEKSRDIFAVRSGAGSRAIDVPHRRSARLRLRRSRPNSKFLTMPSHLSELPTPLGEKGQAGDG